MLPTIAPFVTATEYVPSFDVEREGGGTRLRAVFREERARKLFDLEKLMRLFAAQPSRVFGEKAIEIQYEAVRNAAIAFVATIDGLADSADGHSHV